MNHRLTALLSVLATLVVLLLVALGVVYTGAYNVAATEEHSGPVQWALNTLQHSSVSARAAAVNGSLPGDSASLQHGFEHFDAMCVDCHGAPGVERGELGRGMNPEPPSLEEEGREWTDAELFWITKHGIRLAGMPAFGPTHSDAEIWQIVAFVRKMEGMSPPEYDAWVQALEARSDSVGGGHSHPDGAADHQH